MNHLLAIWDRRVTAATGPYYRGVGTMRLADGKAFTDALNRGQLPQAARMVIDATEADDGHVGVWWAPASARVDAEHYAQGGGLQRNPDGTFEFWDRARVGVLLEGEPEVGPDYNGTRFEAGTRFEITGVFVWYDDAPPPGYLTSKSGGWLDLGGGLQVVATLDLYETERSAWRSSSPQVLSFDEAQALSPALHGAKTVTADYEPPSSFERWCRQNGVTVEYVLNPALGDDVTGWASTTCHVEYGPDAPEDLVTAVALHEVAHKVQVSRGVIDTGRNTVAYEAEAWQIAWGLAAQLRIPVTDRMRAAEAEGVDSYRPRKTSSGDVWERALSMIPPGDRSLIESRGVRLEPTTERYSIAWYDPDDRVIRYTEGAGDIDIHAVVHEIGHAVDHALGWLSESRAFAAVAKASLGTLPRLMPGPLTGPANLREVWGYGYASIYAPGATPFWWPGNDTDLARIIRDARIPRSQLDVG